MLNPRCKRDNSPSHAAMNLHVLTKVKLTLGKKSNKVNMFKYCLQSSNVSFYLYVENWTYKFWLHNLKK